MRSALYYPHTEMTESLLRTSLLYWDRIYTIAPWEGFRPDYESTCERWRGDIVANYSYSPGCQKAFELIGVAHSPTEKEKKETHTLIEDFISRPLPKSFHYASVASSSTYEIYPQKLMYETWTLLQDCGLVGGILPNSDFPSSPAMGLTLMNLLADCCAGTTLARITDQQDAYSKLPGLLVEDDGSEAAMDVARKELIQVSLRIFDATALPLDRLIAMREREAGSVEGASIRDLRHRYVKRIEDQVEIMSKSKSSVEFDELRRQFEEDMKDDARLLREALKMEATSTLATKDIVASVIAAATTVAAWLGGHPLVATMSLGSGAMAISGLLGVRSKFVESRQKILQAHPTAYLYENTSKIPF